MTIKQKIILLNLNILVAVIFLFQTSAVFGASVILEDVNKFLSIRDRINMQRLVRKQIHFHENHFKFKSREVIKLLVFTPQEYAAYSKKNIDGMSSYAGYYSFTRNEIVVKKTKNPFGTIVHEMQHYVLMSKFKYPPNWLNEGLSEFFGAYYIRNKIMYFTVRSKKMKNISHWINTEKMMPLEKFLMQSRQEWNQLNKRENYKGYTLAWGVIYFFMSKRNRREILSNIIKDLKDKKGSSVEVIGRNYKGGFDKFEKDWYSFYEDTEDIPKKVHF